MPPEVGGRCPQVRARACRVPAGAVRAVGGRPAGPAASPCGSLSPGSGGPPRQVPGEVGVPPEVGGQCPQVRGRCAARGRESVPAGAGPRTPVARRCGPCSGRPARRAGRDSVRAAVSRLRRTPAASAVRGGSAARGRAPRGPRVRVRAGSLLAAGWRGEVAGVTRSLGPPCRRGTGPAGRRLWRGHGPSRARVSHCSGLPLPAASARARAGCS